MAREMSLEDAMSLNQVLKKVVRSGRVRPLASAAVVVVGITILRHLRGAISLAPEVASILHARVERRRERGSRW